MLQNVCYKKCDTTDMVSTLFSQPYLFLEVVGPTAIVNIKDKAINQRNVII